MGEMISLKKASEVAACSVSCVRRWVQTGLVDGAKTDGKWQVDVDSLKVHLATHGEPLQSRQGASKKSEPEVEPQQLRVDELLNALSRERALNDELRAENRQLQAEIKEILKEKSGGKGILSRWLRI